MVSLALTLILTSCGNKHVVMYDDLSSNMCLSHLEAYNQSGLISSELVAINSIIEPEIRLSIKRKFAIARNELGIWCQ